MRSIQAIHSMIAIAAGIVTKRLRPSWGVHDIWINWSETETHHTIPEWAQLNYFYVNTFVDPNGSVTEDDGIAKVIFFALGHTLSVQEFYIFTADVVKPQRCLIQVIWIADFISWIGTCVQIVAWEIFVGARSIMACFKLI